MPRDFPENVHRDPGVCHPGQPSVAQIVPTEVLVPELGHDLIPVRSVPEHGCRDSAASWPGEEARRGISSGKHASLNQRVNVLDQRTSRARLPFVPLSISPPGAVVVCCRTVQIHDDMLISPARTPDTSPIRAQ